MSAVSRSRAQQLSVASTRAIIRHLEELFGGHMPSAKELLAADPQVLREAGFSARKGQTLHALAERFVDGRLSDEALAGMTDDEVEAALTEVSGIGLWTARGFLLVALDRPDVFLSGTSPSVARSSARTASTTCRPTTRSSICPIAGGRTGASLSAISSRPSTRNGRKWRRELLTRSTTSASDQIWPLCESRILCRQRKAALCGGFSIGAPRFELGTSSPPD